MLYRSGIKNIFAQQEKKTEGTLLLRHIAYPSETRKKKTRKVLGGTCFSQLGF